MSLVTLQAPNFDAEAVVGKNFQRVKLEDYKGKWVVLFFYPLDFTFVCPTEITALSGLGKHSKRGRGAWGFKLPSCIRFYKKNLSRLRSFTARGDGSEGDIHN